MRATFVIFLYAYFALGISKKLNPLSDEFLDVINSKQKSWKAGRNFPSHTPITYIKRLMGALKVEHLPKLPKMEHRVKVIENLPENFDLRDMWTNCPSLNEIRDQGACGSCWAIAAVGVMTDRYCIHSFGKRQFHFSAEDLLACCNYCGRGCNGGDPAAAFIFWREQGLVSGGNYNSSQGCRPYEIAACDHDFSGDLPTCGDFVDTPICVNSCKTNYNVHYSKDKHYGKSVYSISSEEEEIKTELFWYGPVEATLKVYFDFLHYKEGVYKHTEGDLIGTHSVKILGWGVLHDQKYWLVANSWNTDWGDNGFFKILRGEDHCDIESNIIAGEPYIYN